MIFNRCIYLTEMYLFQDARGYLSYREISMHGYIISLQEIGDDRPRSAMIDDIRWLWHKPLEILTKRTIINALLHIVVVCRLYAVF